MESKIYEFLGVKYFKQLTFKLEKFIHRKDKGQNKNYHLMGNGIEAIENFRKYLYYNGFIHVKNSIALIIGLTVFVLTTGFNYYLIPFILLLIKDLYCVMLQRYNWIKLNEYKEKLEQRENRKVMKEANKIKEKDFSYNLEQINTMLDELRKLKDYLTNNGTVNIDNDGYKMLSEVILETSEQEKKPNMRVLH